MAEAILSLAVETIGKLLIEEGNFQGGVRGQVRLLHEDLKRMQRFLRYADKKQGDASDSVQPWVSDFRGITVEAINLAEDDALRVSFPRKKGRNIIANTLRSHACFFTRCYTRHSFGLEVQSLRGRISNLTKNFSEYGVKAIMEEEGSSYMQQQYSRPTYSFKVEEDIVGLQSDIHLLVNCLLNEGEVGQHHKVVSIFGMGGLGKTTLAREVYHHARLKQHFANFAWICVSQQWDAKDILLGILTKLIPEERSDFLNSIEEELARKLRQFLQDTRCLIVIDDIWSRNAWDSIKHAFPITGQGSKILLTTRNRDVAEYIGPNGFHHQPPFLNQEEGWELLRRKLLKEKYSEGCEDLCMWEELGKKMVKHCSGLPLAVVVLAGILRKKQSQLREWRIVHDNIKSYLEKGEKIGEHGRVPKILAFSYYDLPYQLKSCFLYLGKFKEDSDIEVGRLYQLWMAEGMILEDDRIGQESMMDVAERYLGELAERCMVQVELEEEGRPTITRFKSCRLHDLMRDLCLLKAEEENSFKVIDFQNRNESESSSVDPSPSSSAEIYRGLVLHFGIKDLFKSVTINKKQEKHLQSLVLVVWDRHKRIYLLAIIQSQFNNYKMLRVLQIVSSRDFRYSYLGQPHRDAKSPLESIDRLTYLRYLRLSGFRFFALPSSLKNLEHLETLDLHGCEIERMPNVLCKLENLRHLYLPFQSSIDASSQRLQLDGLKKLEILESFDNDIWDPKGLSKLKNLRVFEAHVYREVEDLEQIINNVTNLNNLCIASLSIIDVDFSENPRVLEQMLFCRNLHVLKIYGLSCKQLPVDHGQLQFFSPGLCELWLDSCKIEEDPMATLEKLPNLRILKFLDSFEGKEMICHAMGFPQLKVLSLSRLPNLTYWQVDEGAMPKLSYLQISQCEKLKMIPDGINHVPSIVIQ